MPTCTARRAWEACNWQQDLRWAMHLAATLRALRVGGTSQQTKHLPFPPCRVALGAKIDAELADRKGRMMQALLDRYKSGDSPSSSPPESGSKRSPPAAPVGGAAGGGAGVNGSAPPSSSCPFGHSSVAAADPAAAAPAAAEAVEGGGAGFEAARPQLYAWDAVPGDFLGMVSAEAAQQAQQLGLVPMATAADGGTDSASSAQGSQLCGLPLAFLDHAWGQVPPLAQVRWGAVQLELRRVACP